MRSTVWVLVAAGVAWSAVAFGDPARELFDKGRWRDAVAEAQREIAANPQDDKPHAELAQLLLNMGLGEAARREARVAVKLQPGDAFNHVVLGWTLEHDAFGRSFPPGWDRAGALAEIKEARKLAPKSFLAASGLGNLYAHGDRGTLWGRGSDAKAAAVAKRVAYDLDPTAENGKELLASLLRAGDFAGAEKLAKSAPESDERDGLSLAAIACRAGAGAAVRAANHLAAQDAKKRALELAARVLFEMRRYPESNALYVELKGPQQPSMFDHIAVRDQPLDRKTPGGVAIEAELAAARDGQQQAMWDAKTDRELAVAWNNENHPHGHVYDWSDEVWGDMLRSGMAAHVEGDKKAWRIEVAMTGKPEVLYAADDHGAIKLIAAAANTHGLGRHALRLIANNDIETARRVLDWAEKDVKKSSLFEMVWGSNHGTDREAVELAAAVLADTSDPDRVRPIVESCAGAPPRGDLACALVLLDLSNARGAWDDSIALLSDRLNTHPQEPLLVRSLALVLTLAGRPKEAERVLRYLGTPTDAGYAKLRTEIAVAENDIPTAIQFAEGATKSKRVTSGELNELAWLEVVTNTNLSDALLAVSEAVRLDTTANTLNTRALIELESGDFAKALEDDWKAIALRLHGTPTNADWYVQGRIAELVGLPDDAIAAYRQVKPPSVRFSTVPDPAMLAQRRLAALGKP